MLSKKNFEIEARVATDIAVRVNLAFEQDRFVTEISGIFDSAVVSLLRSVEGTSQDVWPPSGALQEVLPQEHETGRLLAAVGRAGKSHWSTVVLCSEPAGTVEFDFACRVKEQPTWLGSTYMLDLAQSKVVDEQCVELEIPGQSAKLRCRAMPDSRLTLERPHLRFLPENSEPTLPRTERWKYQFQLVRS